jgi:beta-N-acetylhexosaminidase
MQVGSIVLLGRNVGAPLSTRATLDALQDLAAIPLLVAIDHEGGMVCRFRQGLHPFAGNMALAATGYPAASAWAAQQAEVQARELRAVGINLNLAPCLDVNNNPDNPIIGVRSFADDAATVSALGSQVITGLQDGGVLACAKHFPGHGDTSIDSHLGLPRVEGHWSRLESVELPPFRTAIAAGVGAIMSTHIVFPALDPTRPATLSAAVLTGLLREHLGFGGITVTDCLEMAAIAETVGMSAGAVSALQAGADMVMVCHTLDTQHETVRAIHQAVVAGVLPEGRVREAAGRVLEAKRTFAAPAEASEPWLSPAHDALEAAIARASITLVRNAGAAPLPANADVCVASLHPAADILSDALRRQGVRCRQVTLHAQNASGLREVAATSDVMAADRIVVVTAPREPWSAQPIDQDRQAAIVRSLHASVGDRLIVAAVREPYDIRRFPEIGTYLCTYGYRPCSIAALAKVLAGTAEATGRLPVAIPSVY